MFSLNLPFYLAHDLAPQMHGGSADFLPPAGSAGELPLVPPGCSAAALSQLPQVTWGAAWATAPDPGQPGVSRELLAFWNEIGSPPPNSADLRIPTLVGALDRTIEGTHFASAAQFQGAVAARQVALARNVACFDATGIRYADLQTNQPDGNAGCETLDVFRVSDNTKVGEAFVFRINSAQTVQHWVLRTTDRFTGVRIERRTSGGYSSVTSFLTAQSNAKPANAQWPHVVETCTHFISCPW